ncbi:MAG: phosphatidylglycerophosphatase A [Thioalkalispiraceae bacterium]|jgi:phosphatidylglycerophosphatase A
MKAKPVPLSFLKNPIHFLSLGFGSGLLPKAPGTFGTLTAIPLYLLIILFDSETIYLIACSSTLILGIYLCDYTTKRLGVQDHPAIVWDEIVGFLITMLFIYPTPASVVLGFFLFRVFDILKPWPISVIDSRIKGGIGVMLDDVVAGIFALICMHLIARFTGLISTTGIF